MTDEPGVDCDAYVHLIFENAGMFCPCIPNETVFRYQARMRALVEGFDFTDPAQLYQYRAAHYGRHDRHHLGLRALWLGAEHWDRTGHHQGRHRQGGGEDVHADRHRFEPARRRGDRVEPAVVDGQ